MADREEGRAQRIYDDMIAEEAAPANGVAAPVLPRLRLTVPSSKAPLSIRHKAAATSAPLPDAAQLIPEILKQVDAARRAQAAARAKARNSAAPAPSAGPGPAAAPQAEEAPGQAPQNSRVAWRYALVFGRRIDRVWKGRQRSEDASLDSRAIFSPDTQHHPVPSHVWDHPGWTAWAFLLPALAVFLLFNWLPLLRGLAASFQQVSLVGESHWVGLDNYTRAMGDPEVWATFGHALLLCVLSLALGFWLPVALAIYTNELKRGQALLRTALFLPFLTPAVPAALLWRWILDQGWGLLNSLLSLGPWGPVHIPWLNQPLLAMLSVVLVFLWKNTGWNTMIYLAALKEVPEELYETAELDGAGLWTRIRQVSLPALKPTLRFLLVMQVIGALQIFTEVYLLTGGGPMNSTEMVATYMYKRSFLYLDIGYAAALGVMLFMALLGFSAARLRALEEES
ncbi:MAG TPA: sugar ABC transporter permease [bacterium]|jgi:multiple sugar transport system permease protein|nr:sugar ABC transporter permease [bacterium]